MGARSEFEAIKGTTYVIRVYTRTLYAEGAFHLRMREIRFDGSLTQSASATKVKKGKAVTYTLEIKNLGTIPIEPRGRPAHLAAGQARQAGGGHQVPLDHDDEGNVRAGDVLRRAPGCGLRARRARARGVTRRSSRRFVPSRSLEPLGRSQLLPGADIPSRRRQSREQSRPGLTINDEGEASETPPLGRAPGVRRHVQLQRDPVRRPSPTSSRAGLRSRR